MMYRAPEVFSKEYGQMADIWAMGLVLLYMLIEKNPFPNENLETAISNG